jgi:hypothetical protein
MGNRELDQEASIPVTTRINLKSLAELDIYWSNEEYNIKTMSQLVSWSIDLLCSVLRTNQKSVELATVREANARLVRRGLYQASNIKRGGMKRASALRFESLREEGVNPQYYAPEQYNTVHRSNSVEPMPPDASVEYKSPYEDEYMIAAQARLKRNREELDNAKRGAIEAARTSGMLAESIPERDKEIIAKENAPFNMELLRSQTVKVPKDE